jgi:Protein of unknown function (DUF2807).
MKSFSKIFACLFILIPVFTGCQFDKKTIRGDYEIISEKFAVADYSEIEVNLPAEVIYQQYSDSTPYLQINTDRNVFSYLNIRVENDKLIVEAKPDTIIKPTKLLIYTNSTSLKKVNINGSGDIRLAGEVNSLDLTMALNGSGEIRTDSLLCDKLRINLNGSGKIALNGTASYSSFSINGSGVIDTTEYFSERIDTEINGSGGIIEQSI